MATKSSAKQVALVVAAHPDDIEYCMGGTLMMLGRAGWELHYMNLSAGNCGSAQFDSATTAQKRRTEAQTAAKILGATWHPPLCNDLEIFYEIETLRKLASVIRKVRPNIVLTHSPEDYMEDHMETCRLAVTAAFSKGMPNFKVTPARKPTDQDITVYHAMPHGLRDPLRRRIAPGSFVNTTPVHETKLKSLKAHTSQQNWLDVSQGMNSYLQTMDDYSREVGRLSGKFKYAEGWRRHLHLGLSSEEIDPLKDALKKDCKINKAYERSLEKAGL